MNYIKHGTNQKDDTGNLVCGQAHGVEILGLRWSRHIKVQEVHIVLKGSWSSAKQPELELGTV